LRALIFIRQDAPVVYARFTIILLFLEIMNSLRLVCNLFIGIFQFSPRVIMVPHRFIEFKIKTTSMIKNIQLWRFELRPTIVTTSIPSTEYFYAELPSIPHHAQNNRCRVK
jgi:hypothetical protein